MQFAICYLDWWPELLVFNDQKGAVTAEFMLLFDELQALIRFRHDACIAIWQLT